MDRENERYEAMLGRLKGLKKPNRKAIEDFLNDLRANNAGFNRRIQVGGQLKRVAEYLGDKFLNPERQDISAFMNKLKDENAKERTMNHYVITLKQFYKWKSKSKEAPEFVDWLKLQTIRPEKKDRIDRKTVIDLIDHMKNQRDKVLTMLLFESGMRFGEAVALKRKDVKFSPSGMVITVAGREEGARKTGSREVLVIGDSIAEMKRYLPSRPENPETYIFPMLYGNVNMPCNYDSYVKNLKKSMKEIGLNFNLHAHLFRSNYASDLVERGINQSILEKQLGWSRASRTARFYVDINDEAQHAGIMKAFGMEPEIQKKQETVDLKTCSICTKENPSYAQVCYNCGNPLDISAALRMKEREEEVSKAILDLLPEEMRAIYQNLPPGPARSDMLTLMLLQKEKSGELEQIKKRVKKPESKPVDKPKESEIDDDGEFDTGILHRKEKKPQTKQRLKSGR